MPRIEFDVKPLVHLVDSQKERAFKKSGAFIRADARQSIRVSIRNSKPGQPPKAKRRTFKQSVRFAADKESVVVGPVREAPANSTPHILESGGYREDTLARIRARWERANPEAAREQRKKEKAEARRREQLAKKKKPGAAPPTPALEKPKRKLTKEQFDAMIRRKEKAGTAYKSRQKLQTKVRFYIAPRPYMRPAFDKNKQKTLALLSAK